MADRGLVGLLVLWGVGLATMEGDPVEDRRPPPALPEPDAPRTSLTMMAWNLNSGVNGAGATDYQLEFIRETIALNASRVDVFPFSELHPGWIDGILSAANGVGDFHLYYSESGRDQRLAVLFDKDRLEAVETFEISRIASSGWHRQPIAVTFRDRQSSDVFRVVAVHLARADEFERTSQANRLSQWLEHESSLPTVLLGDFNADCRPGANVATCHRSFFQLMQNHELEWVRPSPETGTTCDQRYNDMLDAVVTTGGADDWDSFVRIDTAGEFCLRMRPGAHFPVFARFEPN